MAAIQMEYPEVVLGAANFGSASDTMCKTTTPEAAIKLLKVLRSYGYNTIDTARRYPPHAQGTSEELIGRTLAILNQENGDNTSLNIDTKVLSNPGDHTPARIAESISTSLKLLQQPKVHTIYAHAPDRTLPLSSPAEAFNTAVKSGHATQWGISNYTLAEVKELLEICDSNHWIRPVVYQGQYNAVARQSETELIPYLHSQGIAFYAFSPAAGGSFGAASRMEMQNAAGNAMRAFYGAGATQLAVERVKKAASDRGISGHEVAIRWVVWHSVINASYGDKVIIGVGSEEQLKGTLDGINQGPLDSDVVQVIEEVWETMEREKAEGQAP